MKPPSPLSLLLFLQLAAGAPVPTPKSHRSTLPDPHFPSHQLHPDRDNTAAAAAHRHAEQAAFNNAPRPPPPDAPPTTALAAPQPLQSSYLQALALARRPARPEPALPAKPTAALPALREDDARRYWEGRWQQQQRQQQQSSSPAASEIVISDGTALEVEVNVEVPAGCAPRRVLDAWAANGPYGQGQRDYSDLLVVGIVLLFLAVVVVCEACEKLGLLRERLCGRRCAERLRRGPIYLEDDEAFVVRKPFALQAAPRSRCESKAAAAAAAAEAGFASDEETDVEGFKYDSDACEKA